MKHSELEKILLKPCNIINKNKGIEINRNNFISNIEGKKINEIYHIYGKIDDKKNIYQTHIKIDFNMNRLISVKCSCEKYREFNMQGHNYYCEHIAATSLRFLHNIKMRKLNKANATKEQVKSDDDKIPLTIHSKLNFMNLNDNKTFYLEFKIGCKAMHNIINLGKFINAVINKGIYKVNDNIVFDFKKYIICDKSRKIFDFMRAVYNQNSNLINCGKLKIEHKDLERFLKLYDEKNILFKDNYLEYLAPVKKELLPLAMTLKCVNNKFVLTSEKNLPLVLNNQNNIYLFNREIYIINKNEGFIKILKALKKNGNINYEANKENYIALISLLSTFTNKVILSQCFKSYCETYINTEFNLYKEHGKIYCEVFALYGNNKVNVLTKNLKENNWIRDEKYEEQLVFTLERYKFIKKESRLLFIGEDVDFFNFNKNNSLNNLGKIIYGKGFESFNIYNGNDLKGALYEEDWAMKFAYKFEGLEGEEFKEAYFAFKNGAQFYKTKKESFIDLCDESVKRLFKLIKVLNLEKDLNNEMSYVNKGMASLFKNLLSDETFSFIEDKKSVQSIENKLEELNNRELPISKRLLNILRDYQMDGVRWLENITSLGFGGILADEMGLGKTLQIIAFLSSKEKTKSIIIAPTSLIYNWVEEFKKFNPKTKVAVIHGDSNKRNEVIENYNKFDVLITSYGTIKNDIDLVKNIEFDYCILDEAQNIKNSKTIIFNVVKEIKSKLRIALTGTPIENNITELWSIFDYIMPGYLYSKEEFNESFNAYDNESLQYLKLLISPFILRRTKKDVLKDLPDKYENKILIELTKEQKQIYKNYMLEIKENAVSLDSSFEMFSYLTKLRQIALHPKLVEKDYIGDSGKLIYAHELIKDRISKNEKILVFSQFTSLLKIFGDELEGKGISYYTITGNTSAIERVRLVNDFNKNDDVKVFLISLKAGGTGLNLTSANLVLHFDPWWNPAVEDQATDRAHRIGQINDVEVIKLVAKGTLEENIIRLQDSKKELIDDVLEGSEMSNINMSKEYLRELLGPDGL